MNRHRNQAMSAAGQSALNRRLEGNDGIVTTYHSQGSDHPPPYVQAENCALCTEFTKEPETMKMSDWTAHIADEHGPVTMRRQTCDGQTVEARIDLWDQLEMTATTAWEYMWISREACQVLFAAHEERKKGKAK